MAEKDEHAGVGLSSTGHFDQDIYGTSTTASDCYSATFIEEGDDDNDDDQVNDSQPQRGNDHHSRNQSTQNSVPSLVSQQSDGRIDDSFDPFAEARSGTRIVDRENAYRKRRFDRLLSPERGDAFGDDTPVRSYKEIMQTQQLEQERADVVRQIQLKQKEQEQEEEEERKRQQLQQKGQLLDAQDSDATPKRRRKRMRWDQEAPVVDEEPTPEGEGGHVSEWDTAASETAEAATPARTSSRWDATPVTAGTATPGRKNRWDETPVASSGVSRWDATPVNVGCVTPAGTGKRSRWDETPVSGLSDLTPGKHGQLTPGASMTDIMNGTLTPELAQRMRWEREIEERNRPLTDEELDALFPATGYKVLDPPASYVPIRTPSRKLLTTPTPMGQTPGFAMQATPAREDYGVPIGTPSGGDGSSMPFIKPEDYQYFGKLMDEVNEEELDPEAARERKIMRLLLRIKNGTPPQRKTALRQLTDKAREFGAGALFNQILPLLMAPTLEDQERHLLVKVIDRVLYKLDDLVRPYVHKILVVIEPLLIDEDYYARVEGREIISNLAKAAGLATMISTMRPDIDIDDEYVRNTTARAFAVVASALGIPALLPFLKAVCQSRKSWQARHTGIKIVQQVAILMGCAVLPHLKHLVEIIEHGLEDEQKVRTITALALAALAEAAHPYGIESFDSVLRPLWRGTRKHHGKGLAAFLKAIGFIIPLMDAQYANYYTVEVMEILIREFQSPDEEMKKIVLKVVKQCVSTDGVEASYIKEKILPEFFRHFWVRRMALDRRNYRQLVETTVELANNVGASEIISRVVDDLKDESEPYRRMVMEAIQKVISNLGATDIGTELEEKLIDGILYAFQEQTSDDTFVMLDGFGIVVNALGIRAKNYLPQICGTIKWRLNNKPAKVRMQAADLINRIAVVMKTCDQEPLMGHMGVVLYEYLGEEYPEVLGSILGALKAIVNVIGMSKMTPPIKDLLPRLTPILKNRHEKVQENCIAEGTLVAMADGTSKSIELLVEGDRVMSPCVAKDNTVVADLDAACTRVLDNGSSECVELKFEDDRELVCTPDHRLLRFDGKWQTAGEVPIGCQISVAVSEKNTAVSGELSVKVIGLRVIQRRNVGVKRIFDLTVPGNDAFFAAGVAVHNCIDLVGRIADRGADLVSAREWMRICFELLDMLKAHKKGIRRAAVNTFGYIAKAIGPQDVLHTLLNNLKVQERQNRVCTTVAIAIVAETCSPFTVVPALMNEYRVPELNVQNGVLKAFSFMFEYIGEMGKDYIYAVAPLLQDALMDRDLVHRQTACTTVKHLALGVTGLGCEDALVHLLNFVWPNIFETSPHVINAVFEAVEGCRVALGPHVILQYVLQGLFHPARRVREVYWKIYNSLYMYAQDGLTPAYPVLEDDGVNTYNRTYLELVI
uniref:Hint domain-containing protein n=1 Tax=Hyaloperonospora arabidopsidis (strain Emoy2) TaxID=559515 RepID=M4BK12_HYAAE